MCREWNNNEENLKLSLDRIRIINKNIRWVLIKIYLIGKLKLINHVKKYRMVVRKRAVINWNPE